MPPELEGIIPPVVTPFDQSDSIDEEKLRKEIQYNLDVGVHGISVAGTTGEGNALTLDEHATVYDIAVDEVDDELPVVGGAIAASTKEAIAKAQVAEESGVDYLMVTPPQHYITPSKEGILEYFTAISDNSDIPIVIYDVVDHVDVNAELVEEMTDRVPNLYGIKQSGGDFHGLNHMLNHVGDKVQIVTALDDLMYPSFQVGAKGAISGFSAVCPRICVEIWDAVQEGDTDRAEKLHFATLPLARDAVWNSQVDFPGGVKTAIKMLGREPGEIRPPMQLPDEEKRNNIREAIHYMNEEGVEE